MRIRSPGPFNGPLQKALQAAWLFWLLALAAVAANADDAFATEQQKAVAANPAGVTLTLSLPAGKTEFRQGDIVPLTLNFSSAQPGYTLNRFLLEDGLDFDVVHAAPTDGVADPLAEIRHEGSAFSGGIPSPLPLTTSPTSLTITLNEQIRFDRPGLYRLYVTSRRILGANAGPSDSFEGGQTATSSIVTLTIVPADQAWAHAQVQGALATLSIKHWTPEYRPALRVLRYLGTQEAARALLGRLSADEEPNSSASDAEECRPGLIGFPDRPWLIGEMRQEISQADYAVSPAFLETLTFLGATPDESPYAPPERLRAAWQAAADAVSRKTGRVRAMTLYTLVNKAWWDAALTHDAPAQSRLPGLTRQLAAAFDDLPSLLQSNLLGDYDWPRLQNQPLLPALRRLLAGTKPPENYAYGLTDLALHRLYELSPKEGRDLILEQIQSLHPNVSAAALTVLPDQTLPALDQFFATHLQDDGRIDDLDITAPLAARYATGAIFPEVQKAYDWGTDGWACRIQTDFLAYFLRVRPDYGLKQVEVALARRKTTGCFHRVLLDVAEQHYIPELEPIAIHHLDDPDPEVSAGALQVLQEHGSTQAEAALLDRLSKSVPEGAPRAAYETALVDALAKAQNWRIDQKTLGQIRALCQTQTARQRVDQYAQEDSAPEVLLYFNVYDNERWQSGRYSGNGWETLGAKLAQYPRGTTFTWRELGSETDEEADKEKRFQRVQAIAQAHGLTIKRPPRHQ